MIWEAHFLNSVQKSISGFCHFICRYLSCPSLAAVSPYIPSSLSFDDRKQHSLRGNKPRFLQIDFSLDEKSIMTQSFISKDLSLNASFLGMNCQQVIQIYVKAWYSLGGHWIQNALDTKHFRNVGIYFFHGDRPEKGTLSSGFKRIRLLKVSYSCKSSCYIRLGKSV